MVNDGQSVQEYQPCEAINAYPFSIVDLNRYEVIRAVKPGLEDLIRCEKRLGLKGLSGASYPILDQSCRCFKGLV